MSDIRTDFLRQYDPWTALSAESLQSLAGAMDAQRFESGQCLIHEGDLGTHLHVVTSGRVAVRVRTDSGSIITVAELGSGSCVGEMSLLTGDPASADVVALDTVETLSLDRGAFHVLTAADSHLQREFLRIVSRRLRTTDVTAGSAREKEEGLTRFLHEEKSEQYTVLVGKGKEMKALRARIDEETSQDTPLLILGEAGTGKELVARTIHFDGPRKTGPLLSVDCARIAETQWGDQLLGDRDRDPGDSAGALCYLELARGGMLLLKNLEKLPPGIQERLAGHLEQETESGSAADVRVAVTCKEALAGGSSPVLPHLAGLLSPHALALPPLRDRKRDIPALAEHFLERHASRLEKPVTGLDDLAVAKLVAYDYRLGNISELEAAIERAVVLSEHERLRPEEVFLGAPPSDRPHGLNLLKLPAAVTEPLLQLFPKVFQWAVAAFFAGLVMWCFVAPATAASHPTTLLIWGVWWPALVLSFFFAGRAWCAVCPMAFAGHWAQRLAGRGRPIPAWLKTNDLYVVMGGFLAIVWVEEATGMRHSPLLTGVLLLSILAGAVVIGLLFPRRTWCRHLCPLGGLASLCSTSSLLELRPTHDICSAKCRDHSCYKGGASAGCPMFQHVMFLDSNEHCVLCLNCVRSCPNASPQLNLRVPARELWTTFSARPDVGRFTALLLGLLAAQSLIQLWEHGPSGPLAQLLHAHRFAFVSAMLPLVVAVPVVALWLAERHAAREAAPHDGGRFWHLVTAWLPLIGAGYTAYQLAFVPGLSTLNLALGAQVAGAVRPVSVTIPVLAPLQFVLLATGLTLTLVALWRRWPLSPGTAGVGLAEHVGGLSGVAGCCLVLLGLLGAGDWIARLTAAQLALLLALFGGSYWLALAEPKSVTEVLATPEEGSTLVRLLSAFIGLHSCALGLAMLFATRQVLAVFGFPADVPTFFPSQSGIFLLILGLLYLWAVAEPALVKVIVLSKAMAVVFLLVHVALLGSPAILWAAAAGDAAMLGVLGAAIWRERAQAGQTAQTEEVVLERAS